ncbi:hypothetical protein [Sphingomonas sp. VNH70]|uniref:hypothetical protein n=1 Tax=Sphingomonas silueang TaxID=3156617 RepID=UPI0032B5638A
MTDAVLNLETLVDRPKISIDGVQYEILSPDELALLTSHRVAALGRKLDKLLKADELNATGEKQLSATLEEMIAIIMEPVPVAVRARLSDAHKMSVVEVFTMLSLARKATLAGAMVKNATASTGAKPSPGSSADTAATPSAG